MNSVKRAAGTFAMLAVLVIMVVTSVLGADLPYQPANTTPRFLPFALFRTGNQTTATPTSPAPSPTTPAPTATTPVPTSTSSSPTATSSTPTATNPAPTSTVPVPDGMILVDHTSLPLFDQIPDTYLTAARNLDMIFMDRSVGYNIDAALNCLAYTSWPDASSACRRDYYDIEYSGGTETWLWRTFNETDLLNGDVPALILFEPDAVIYNRSNWDYTELSGTWQEIVRDFVTIKVPAYINSYDVISFQFSYLNIDEGSTIDDVNGGFFDADPGNPNRWDISDLEALEAQHPNKTFIYWTTSLARNIGTVDGTNFNNQMRAYAIENDKILFDVAAIESHDPLGNQCYDSRDGICYCNTNQCEDYSLFGQSCNWNDGVNIPAICQEYTTETLGGHLGSVSGAQIRIAKAFWVLMAQIAGWSGNP